MCSGKREVIHEVATIFNQETNDGKDMSKYSMHLETAISNIYGKEVDKGISSLFTKGDSLSSNPDSYL
ncbi:MAG: hypothetical protein A2Y24_07525 [Clostridiales bacterium GWE2_32_10]|nr:MAG: hypothetical protein A2Y24_07525 [Clostridiales bacterium GWE2_32_10]HBY21608.1 hypothetical protein [Clostridiales bacterium]